MSVKPTMTVCVAVPALLLLSGLGMAGYYGYREIPALEVTVASGQVPPGFEAVIAEPGKYNLWLATDKPDYPAPAGMRLHVFSNRTKQELPLDTWFRSSRWTGSSEYVSMGRFEAAAPHETVGVKSVGTSGILEVSVSRHNESGSFRIILTLMALVAMTIPAAIPAAIPALLFPIHRRQRHPAEEAGRH